MATLGGMKGISIGYVRRGKGFFRFQRDLVGAAESEMTPSLPGPYFWRWTLGFRRQAPSRAVSGSLRYWVKNR